MGIPNSPLEKIERRRIGNNSLAEMQAKKGIGFCMKTSTTSSITAKNTTLREKEIIVVGFRDSWDTRNVGVYTWRYPYRNENDNGNVQPITSYLTTRVRAGTGVSPLFFRN
jgi:hypothetical protein